jgi:hypothetical protein
MFEEHCQKKRTPFLKQIEENISPIKRAYIIKSGLSKQNQSSLTGLKKKKKFFNLLFAQKSPPSSFHTRAFLLHKFFLLKSYQSVSKFNLFLQYLMLFNSVFYSL